MQAQSQGISLLFLFFNILAGIATVSVLCFLELLHSLPYTPHKLRYLTPSKEKDKSQDYKDYFCWTDLSHIT